MACSAQLKQSAQGRALSEELARHSLIYLGIRCDNSKKRAAG